MLKASKARVADMHGATATRSASWHWGLFQDSVPHVVISATGRSIVAHAQRSNVGVKRT